MIQKHKEIKKVGELELRQGKAKFRQELGEIRLLLGEATTKEDSMKVNYKLGTDACSFMRSRTCAQHCTITYVYVISLAAHSPSTQQQKTFEERQSKEV